VGGSLDSPTRASVYEAEQNRPRRRVALKAIRSGLATPGLLARFEHEVQRAGSTTGASRRKSRPR
jgi:hypothetical protein